MPGMHRMHKCVAPVVITRPLAQARNLQKKLVAAGAEVILFPLLEIHPLADYQALDAVLAKIDTFDLVAFVSPNAIDAAFARRAAWPPGLPLAVIGAGSRRSLQAHGVDPGVTPIFSPHDPDRTDSQTLLDALDLQSLAGSKVLILRGESGRELLADALRSAGAIVTQIAAYRRCAPVLDAAGLNQLQQLLSARCRWIISSSEALQILVSMTKQAFPEQSTAISVSQLQQQMLVVPHVRIAQTAQALGFCNVLLTASGDERLLAALQF